MNSITVKPENKEELIERRGKFPIEFEVGSPFGVSENTTLTRDKQEIPSIILPREKIEEMVALSDIAPSAREFLSGQLKITSDLKRKIPNNTYVLNNIGKAYLNSGDIEKAISCFEEALKLKADSRLAKVNLAKAYTMLAKYDDALKLYREEEKKSPSDSKLLMGIAHIYVRQGKLDNARKVFNKILSFDPKNAGAHHNRGIISLANRKWNDAISDFRKALTINERLSITYNAIGVCYLLRNNYKQAIKHLTIALGIDKSNPTTLKNLASAYSIKGDHKKSVQLLEKHLLSNPMDVHARDIAATAYFHIRDYDASRRHLQFILKNQEQLNYTQFELARILNNIGVLYRQLGLFDQAISVLTKATELCDALHMGIAYGNLMNLYLSCNKTKEAESLVTRYLSKEPKELYPLNSLSGYYLRHNNYIRAEELATQILGCNQKNVGALATLSFIRGEIDGDMEKSIEFAEKAYEYEPSDVVSANNLAYAYLMSGKFDRAGDIINTAKIDKANKAAFVFYATKGLLRLLEGNIGEGMRLYIEAESMAPDAEWKRLVRQKKHLELGKYYLVRKEYVKAAKEFRSALSVKTGWRLYSEKAQTLEAETNSEIRGLGHQMPLLGEVQ